MQRIFGFCQTGGQFVSTQGVLSTTEVQASYPGCTVTVFNQGLGTLASIFADNGVTPKANPFVASASDGTWFFYIASGQRVDVQLTGGTPALPSTVTLGDILGNDVGSNFTPTLAVFQEGTPSGAAVGLDVLAASTAIHGFVASYNNGAFLPLAQIPSGQTNVIPKFSATALVASGITDNGTTITFSEALASVSIANSGSLTTKRLENIRFADAFASGSATGGLQEAINDLPAGGGIVCIPPNYTAVCTATVNISVDPISIIGLGVGPATSSIQLNHTGAGFNITASNFNIDGVDINVSSTSSRAGVGIFSIGAQVGTIKNCRFTGNATSPNCGIVYSSTGFGAAGGLWNIYNNRMITASQNWTAFIKITNSNSSSTVADFNIYNNIVSLFTIFSDAAVVFDGGIDTVQMWGNVYGGNPGTGLAIRNTVGSAINPRFLHFTDDRVEGGSTAGSTPAVNIAASGPDVQFQGYIATAGVGLAVGATARSVDIHDVHFENIGQSAITVAAGAIGVRIHDCTFSETGKQTSNTFDTISVAANTTDIDIHGNYWQQNGANFPRYGINLNGGTGARVKVYGNNIPSSLVATGAINGGALPSGADVQIFANSQRSSGAADDFTISAIQFQEGALPAPGASAGVGFVYADSTAHRLKLNNNATAFSNVALFSDYTATLKKGSGGGNYTTASTTYVVVDSTNLCLTITIPTGTKLLVQAQGSLGTATAAVLANIALTDNAACSTANAGVLVEQVLTGTGAGVLEPFALGWIITGDGASHNIALQYKTSNGADSATILNSSGTSLPTMTTFLTPG